MADEQATVETTTPVEVVQDETPVEATPTPVVDTPATSVVPAEPDLGDPRVAMQEERKKRQQLEQLAQNPDWIYERARALGLAQDDTPSPAPLQTAPQTLQASVPDVSSIVEHQLDFRETIKAHPEFDPARGDKALVKWAAALVDDGHKPSEAVDIILKTMDKRTSQATASAVEDKLAANAQAEAAKMNADSISSTVNTSPDASELEDLNNRAKNWKNPSDQEAAILEKLKRSMVRT